MTQPIAARLGELILGVDHVAIAVTDMDASIARYTEALGFALAERKDIRGEHSGMAYAVLKTGDTTLVLVQGTSPASQVSKFLATFGAGMHHIAFAVNDLDEAIARATASGISVDTPVVSDEGIRQAFLQRDAATGVRVELIERHGVPFSERNVEGLFRALEAKELY
jgi:methylmalonyl-CoA/ethylmalonyl-CoA epimerase